MAYFVVCIFISAFLLFQVEPMIGKYILPLFGGSSSVWSTVMLFFQVMLTGGYAYAYWLIGKARRKTAVHLVLLGVSLVLMLVLGLVWRSPITPGANLKPGGSYSPIVEIFIVLTVSVGLPYFLLASNSPLIQVWFDRAFPGRTAYRLYALSNAGSLLALVTYPLLVEPNLTLPWQGWVWSLAYAAYAGLAAYGAIRAFRRNVSGGSVVESAGKSADEGTKEPYPHWSQFLLWITLAATASILLLAVTSQITQEVAVIPFLWVLPLTIYLLTFILAFSGERWYSRQLFIIIFAAASLLAGWALGHTPLVGIWQQIGIYSLVLFAACMVCHGELYRMRPDPLRLTSFYLMVSIGGALGGIVINFVAPLVFKGLWELPLGLALCWLFFLAATIVSRRLNMGGTFSIRTDRSHRPPENDQTLEVSSAHRRDSIFHRLIFIVNETILLGMLVVMSIWSYQQIHIDLNNGMFITRNFYGIVRVSETVFAGGTSIPVKSLGREISSFHRFSLIHGVTIHGFQFHDEGLSSLPTSYYGRTSGVGLAVLNSPNRGRGMKVGVLGLGVGTLAAYGQPGDIYRFYEINPAVIRLAEGEGGYFNYLSSSQARVEIVTGDARLSLENELAAGRPGNYDILVVDVFSSDSIPVHLLDAEAFALYLKHLQPEGILAIHISNSHLNLVPVVWPLAGHFGLSRVLINDLGDGIITYQSEWVLLSRDPALLAIPAIASRAEPMSGYVSPLRLWTDDYNNLIQILK